MLFPRLILGTSSYKVAALRMPRTKSYSTTAEAKRLSKITLSSASGKYIALAAATVTADPARS